MIDKVVNNCTGCGACGDKCPVGAITFKYNAEGFAYPDICIDICTRCNLCEQVCPILNEDDGFSKIISYASYSYSKPKESSSGGMFYSLASSIIEDNGFVYGAAFNNEMRLTHVRINQIDDLKKLCGSKYVQSDCIGIYKQVQSDLKSGFKVLFSGTPCQVAGLKRYLRKEYESLYMIDLICHGVPSPKLFTEWIQYCEQLRNKRVVNFLTRDNREGWDNKFRSTLYFGNGKEEYNSMLSNLWNRIFFSELATRKSCSNCRFAKINRQGDITLGDFWGIENACPVMYDRYGVSLIQVNTEKGQKIFDKLSCHYRSQQASTTEKEHPNLYHPTHENPLREQFMCDYAQYGFAFVIKRYFGFTRWLDFKSRLKKLVNKMLKR